MSASAMPYPCPPPVGKVGIVIYAVFDQADETHNEPLQRTGCAGGRALALGGKNGCPG
jgi:hypothetical protein